MEFKMKSIRVYADTSVFGGCFDDEFAEDSKRFFEEVRAGKFILFLSDIVLLELTGAPRKVQELLDEISPFTAEPIRLTNEVRGLRDAYIEAGIVTSAALRDAAHIAAATIAEVDVLISWNFKHIVHYEKIRGFNGISLLKGYKPILIHSPREVIDL
jgi:hypothetical protein